MSLENVAINLLQTIFTSSDQIERRTSEQTILQLCEENESFLKVLENIITIESVARDLKVAAAIVIRKSLLKCCTQYPLMTSNKILQNFNFLTQFLYEENIGFTYKKEIIIDIQHFFLYFYHNFPLQLNETIYYIENNMKEAGTVKSFLSSTLIINSLLKFMNEKNINIGFSIDSILNLIYNFLRIRLKEVNEVYIEDDEKLWELNISVECLHHIVRFISIFFPWNNKIKMEIFDFLNDNYIFLSGAQILIHNHKYTKEKDKLIDFTMNILQILIFLFQEKKEEEFSSKEEYFLQRIMILLIEFCKDIDNFSLLEIDCYKKIIGLILKFIFSSFDNLKNPEYVFNNLKNDIIFEVIFMFFVPNEEEKFLFYDAPDDFITQLIDTYDANPNNEHYKVISACLLIKICEKIKGTLTSTSDFILDNLESILTIGSYDKKYKNFKYANILNLPIESFLEASISILASLSHLIKKRIEASSRISLIFKKNLSTFSENNISTILRSKFSVLFSYYFKEILGNSSIDDYLESLLLVLKPLFDPDSKEEAFIKLTVDNLEYILIDEREYEKLGKIINPLLEKMSPLIFQVEIGIESLVETLCRIVKDYNCMIKQNVFKTFISQINLRVFKEYEFKPIDNQILFSLLNLLLSLVENNYIQLYFLEELENNIESLFLVVLKFDYLDTVDEIIRLLNCLVKAKQKFPQTIIQFPNILDAMFKNFGLNLTKEPIFELTHLILNNMIPIPKLFILKIINIIFESFDKFSKVDSEIEIFKKILILHLILQVYYQYMDTNDISILLKKCYEFREKGKYKKPVSICLNELFLLSFYYFEIITSEFFQDEKFDMIEKIIDENDENINIFPYNKKIIALSLCKLMMFQKENVLINKAKPIIQKYFPNLLVIMMSFKEHKNDNIIFYKEICQKRKMDFDALIECKNGEGDFLPILEENTAMNESCEPMENDDFEEVCSDSEITKNKNDFYLDSNYDVKQILEDFISPIKSIEIFSIFQEAFSYLKLTNQTWLNFIISKLDHTGKKYLNEILQIKKIEIEEDNKKITVTRKLVKIRAKKKEFKRKELDINTFNLASDNINTDIYFEY